MGLASVPRVPVECAEANDQARQHLLHASRRFRCLVNQLDRRQFCPRAQVELKLQLARRAERDSQEEAQVTARRSAAAFCDIGTNGYGRPPHLAGELVPLARWKLRGDPIYLERQVARCLIRIQTPGILHAAG